MSDACRVDPEALTDIVERMGEFARYVEGVLAEIDSLAAHLRPARGLAAHAEAHRHLARGQAMMRAALARLAPAPAVGS
jgi:hypothetical protein